MKALTEKTELLDLQIMKQFDSYLHSLVDRSATGKLLGMIEYHLGWRDEKLNEVKVLKNGKRSRPILCILIHSMFTDNINNIFPVAAAIELIHNFSLIYDDIQDKSLIRRGRPSIWSLWGEDEAINVGCIMQTLVHIALSELKEIAEPGKVLEIIDYTNHVMMRICNGQQKDIEMAKVDDPIKTNQYLEMINGKTASLFGAATFLGAHTSGADISNQEYCREFGENLGMAFQIFDDIVGIWGLKENGLDKPISDITNRKKTYPIIYTYEKTRNSKERMLLQKYYSNKPLADKDVDLLKNLIERKNGKQTALVLGLNYLSNSLRALGKIKAGVTTKQTIEKWVQFVIKKQLETAGIHDPFSLLS